MKTQKLCSLTLSGLMAFGGYARAEDKPAVPAGHPDIEKAEGGKALPPGHPPMGGSGGMPAGHPPMSGMKGMGGMGGMPAGHPAMPGMAAPSTQPAATSATLAIRIIQGTKDAPALKLDTATVELWHRGSIIKTLNPKLDANGGAVLADLSVQLAFQPVVKVNYNGVDCIAIGKPMDGMNAAQQLDLKVYELADKAPQWQVAMRHLMITPTPQSLEVVEVMAVENPTDRTWPGVSREDGKRAALVLPLPENATDVQTGSAVLVGTGQEKGTLVSTVPLTPGMTQYKFGYQIPMKDGKATLTLTNPALVKNMIVFVGDAPSVKVEGLESAGAQDMGHGKSNMYRGAELQAGSKTSITVAAPAAAEGEAAPGAEKQAAGGSAAPKVIAGVGGGLILAIGAGIVFAKGPKKAS